MRGDNEAAPVWQDSPPSPGFADLSASPVDFPRDENPIASAETLAAAVAQDTTALKLLNSQPLAERHIDSNNSKTESSGHVGKTGKQQRSSG